MGIEAEVGGATERGDDREDGGRRWAVGGAQRRRWWWAEDRGRERMASLFVRELQNGSDIRFHFSFWSLTN